MIERHKLKIAAAIPAFKAPREAAWCPTAASDEGDEAEEKNARNNRDNINNVLLASMQMPHLVVLAGSGCSLSAGGPSMNDLWVAAVGEEPSAQAKEVAAKVQHDLAKNNIEAFLSRIEAFLHINDDKSVSTFLDASKKVILEKCSSFLADKKLNAHTTFLHRLSRRRVRDQRLKVFTTNYDLCFERAAGELGGVALDGFSFGVPRRYDPRFFGYDIVRRPRSGDDLGSYLEGVFLLYKLHGSVNWARMGDGKIFEKVKPEPNEACLIYPANVKFQQAFTQPHLESMAQYLGAVREPNTCLLVAGYGFNDDHLSEPMLAAAQTNPHLRLIVVDPFAKKHIEDDRQYWKQLNELSQSGEDIWFIEANFDDFVRMIPDLKSLTPADTLMRAIQGVTKQ